MYQNLKSAIALPKHVNRNNPKQLQQHLSRTESIHYLLVPEYQESYIDKQIEDGVANMQNVIELGWMIREKNGCPLKVVRLFVCLFICLFICLFTCSNR